MNQSGKSIKEIAKQFNKRPESIYPLIQGEGVIKWDKKTKKIHRVKKQFHKPLLIENEDYFYTVGDGYRITESGESKIAAKYSPVQVVEN